MLRPQPGDQDPGVYAPDWVRACCREPHFLFLDEINAAVTKLHQAASYSIVFEHRVGPFAFHAQTVVMAAGNFEEDEALAVPMSTALQNRFRHFIMRVDAEAWLLWAAKQGLSPDIMAFISAFREHALHRRTGEYAYATRAEPGGCREDREPGGPRTPAARPHRLLRRRLHHR